MEQPAREAHAMHKSRSNIAGQPCTPECGSGGLVACVRKSQIKKYSATGSGLLCPLMGRVRARRPNRLGF